MTYRPKVFVYLYPGWTRNRLFDEWEIVKKAKPSFPEHKQPRIPLNQYYYEDLDVIKSQIKLARKYGIDGFIFCWYWDQGQLLLPHALDAFLEVVANYNDFKFAVMWANRIPHIQLPISRKDLKGDFYEAFGERIVKTNRVDLRKLIEFCQRKYFSNPAYINIDGRPIFSIFSMRDLFASIGCSNELDNGELRRCFGEETYLIGVAHGLEEWLEDAKRLGLDALSSYVLLPDWHGPQIQQHERYARRARLMGRSISEISELPYYPAVTVGWDASPRGKETISEGRQTYPWCPIIMGSTPKTFRNDISKSLMYCRQHRREFLAIASWNEWSEGHYLEADKERGYEWLEELAKEIKK